MSDIELISPEAVNVETEKKIDLADKLKIVQLNGKIQLGFFKIEFVIHRAPF